MGEELKDDCWDTKGNAWSDAHYYLVKDVLQIADNMYTW